MSRPVLHSLLAASLVLTGGLACALASDPLPAPEEVLLTVSRTQGGLEVIPVASPGSGVPLPLGGAGSAPGSVVGRDHWALVPFDSADALAVVDLQTRTLARTIDLAAGTMPSSAAFVDDSIAYVANPGRNTVTRINYLTGDTASLAVGIRPRSVVFTRGRVFVINSNSDAAGNNVLGPSWISVVDPSINRLAAGIDSIALPGPGNAGPALVAQDGVLYVMSRGPVDGTTEARLSLVDPVGRRELGNFAGFGNAPGPMATDGLERLYISSVSQGLMSFDLVNREVLRGAGDGVAIPGNSGVAVDNEGRIYALEPGACSGGAAGQVHVLRPDLSESRTIVVAECPSGAAITAVSPAS